MSLRSLLVSMVLVAAFLVPALNVLLLDLFPPPPPMVLEACMAGEQPTDARGLCLHTMSEPPRPRFPALGTWFGFRPAPPGPPPHREGGTGMPEGHGPPPVDNAFQGIRDHFLWVNLLSLGIVVLLTMLLTALAVRRPIRGLLAAIRDIEHGSVPPPLGGATPRELRQISQALHRLGLQLRSNHQERELMLASMSHDLRSPLARIQAAVQLRGQPEADWLPVLCDVDDIDHIIEQCIAWVRDGRDEALSQVSLDELVRLVLRGEQDAEVQLDLQAPSLHRLRRLSLMRAIRNLVDNALSYGAAPVRVSTRQSREGLVLRVEDQGAGINSEDWERFLKPFVQGARERKPGGAGLGLAIVCRVAEQHGGVLRLSAAGRGQPFAIELHLPSRL